MIEQRYDEIQIGEQIATLTVAPINRTTLALYCGASADHNPIHVDIDFARKARMPDVFAHGMLSAAYVARLLTDWVPQQQLRSLAVRFNGITHLGNQPTVTGRVTEKFEMDGEKRIRLELRCTNQYGDEKILAEAVVALN